MAVTAMTGLKKWILERRIPGSFAIGQSAAVVGACDPSLFKCTTAGTFAFTGLCDSASVTGIVLAAGETHPVAIVSVDSLGDGAGLLFKI